LGGGRRLTEFFDRGYKTERRPTGDNVAKFLRDRPRELGDLGLKKTKRKEETAVKHKTAGNTVPGGLIKTSPPVTNIRAA